ncbi:polyprenol dehydrogenase-like isoform X2 [Onthophagus taurus]|uniref:polyprenol dehydrogenase-like isoform X2 n=1 Tax=Onthophagus taurus TaxID=166361 RepID=UPI000C205924|nr:dehydrogenase/reductase SDR family member on chromosome X homolog isoform X1 [Onthophagus taurus]
MAKKRITQLYDTTQRKMILLISFIVIAIGVCIAIYKSEKPAKQILAEAKFEIIYALIGSKSLFEDIWMIGRNKTELPNKTGKVAVITGGTKGIGAEVVRMLLECDLTVVIGCRNQEAGQLLIEKIREEGILTGDVNILPLDVSSIASVKKFANRVCNDYPTVDILINNAGIMYVPFEETEDGFESQVGVNYIGHFVLTHLLLEKLKQSGVEGAKSRVINLSSIAHEAGIVSFDDFNSKNEYMSFAAYAQSKLAQLLFSNYLNKMMKEEGFNVESFAVHPGVVNTDLFDGTYIKKITPWAIAFFFKSPEKGAVPVVFAAVSPKAEGLGGSYISNCEPKSPSKTARDVELQEKLFNFTLKMLNIKEFGKVE